MHRLMRLIPAILLIVIAAALPASAAVLVSGGEVTIGEPVDDDLFVSGGTIIVDAPVGSLTAAGGTIQINAPVAGDVYAMGGTVRILADVGGKVVAAGGTVIANANISRNLIATGDTLIIGPDAAIGRDAVVSGRNVRCAGTVDGTLTVSADSLTSTGTAGELVVINQQQTGALSLTAIITLLSTFGFLLLGLLLIRLVPGPYNSLVAEVRDRTVRSLLIGLGLLVGGAVAILLLAVTMIGLPFALTTALLLLLSAMLSSLFVSSCLGEWLSRRTARGCGPYTSFIVGFLILHIILALPLIGLISRVVVVAIGTGAAAALLKRAIPENKPAPECTP